jgi:hypothetical protein
MSLIKYILQSCDESLRYRVTFTGATSLNIGETWFVECGGIESGCYQVEENTDETLDEYNSDECTFVEFDDCDDCDAIYGENLAVEQCYKWLNCQNPNNFIYIPINYDDTDYAQINGNCWERRDGIYNVNPTVSSIGYTLFRESCDHCFTFLNESQVPCYTYVSCPDDPRSFDIVNAVQPFSTTLINYPTSLPGAGVTSTVLKKYRNRTAKMFHT